MADGTHTLDELVARTGFTKRQIRYYITRKLVPGAGAARGPYAVYSAETLHRLLMISALKKQPVGPSGRTMTLAEIRYELEGASESKAIVGGCASNSALDFLERLNDSVVQDEMVVQKDMGIQKGMAASGDMAVKQPEPAESDLALNIAAAHARFAERPALHDLLWRLHAMLTSVGLDTSGDQQAGSGEKWQRLTSPEVEIQVRIPDTKKAQQRLDQMAAELGDLLMREE